MHRYGTVGQWFWFVFGSAVVPAFGTVIEPLLGLRTKIGNVVYDDSLLPWLLAMWLPLLAILSVLFAVWHNLRTNQFETSTALVWWIPFVLGLVFLPTCMLLIAPLLYVKAYVPKWLGETYCFIVPFGLPALAAEICLRLALRRNESAD